MKAYAALALDNVYPDGDLILYSGEIHETAKEAQNYLCHFGGADIVMVPIEITMTKAGFLQINGEVEL